MQSVFAMCAAWCFVCGVAIAQQDPPAAAHTDPADRIERMRKALGEYAEAKKTASRERAEWQQARQLLETRIAVVQREIDALQQRIDEANQNIAEAEGKYGELQANIAAREQVATGLEQRIPVLEARASALLQRIPPVLRSTQMVKTLGMQLPANADEAGKLSLSQRYQNVIGLLNAIDKWNRDVHVESELRDLGNGQEMLVEVIYVGLGQAWYVGGRGADGKPTVAGVGSASRDGWQWRSANEMAQQVATAIAVFKNEQLARLVQLPVQIL